jgi:hypothetical protein
VPCQPSSMSTGHVQGAGRLITRRVALHAVIYSVLAFVHVALLPGLQQAWPQDSCPCGRH